VEPIQPVAQNIIEIPAPTNKQPQSQIPPQGTAFLRTLQIELFQNAT